MENRRVVLLLLPHSIYAGFVRPRQRQQLFRRTLHGKTPHHSGGFHHE